MGELSIDATKCKYCSEKLEEDKERTREILRREGEDTAKREVRRQIQDKAREKIKSDKSGKPKTTQKSISKSEGIKKWWAGQSTGVKAAVVLCVGMVAFGSIYLASGTNQGAPYQLIGSNNTSDNVNQSSSGSGHSGDSGSSSSSKREICKDCGGKGYWICNVCNGTGVIDCTVCGGDGKVPYYKMVNNSSTKSEIQCTKCGGDGKITCPGGQYTCIGGKTPCPSCGADGYFEPEKGDSYFMS